MPMLTDIQSYAAEVMRALICVRREQIHWMIKRKYPYVTPEKIMRQLRHVLRIYDDGEHYLWPGTKLSRRRVAAVDVMLTLCKGSLPIIASAPRLPCALLFFVPVPQSEAVLAYRVYAPRLDSETECRTLAENERQPLGHAVIFLVSDKSQISLLRVSHPHLFAFMRGDGTYEFIKARE